MADDGRRAQRKAGRRAAQLHKEDQKHADEAAYFWQCAKAARGGGGAPGKPSAAELFGTQGTSGIDFDQYDRIPVSRSGPDASAIAALDDFAQLKAVLPPFLTRNLTDAARMGYTKPTPIQKRMVADVSPL